MKFKLLTTDENDKIEIYLDFLKKVTIGDDLKIILRELKINSIFGDKSEIKISNFKLSYDYPIFVDIGNINDILLGDAIASVDIIELSISSSKLEMYIEVRFLENAKGKIYHDRNLKLYPLILNNKFKKFYFLEED
jgi:hypothetical protein